MALVGWGHMCMQAESTGWLDFGLGNSDPDTTKTKMYSAINHLLTGRFGRTNFELAYRYPDGYFVKTLSQNEHEYMNSVTKKAVT